MGNQIVSILAFIVQEIPFLIFIGFLIYIFWVRPKKKAEQKIREAEENQFRLGDRLLFNDGMVGELVKDNGDHTIIVTSGCRGDKFKKKIQDIYLNLSCEERKKAMQKKHSLKAKIFGK